MQTTGIRNRKQEQANHFISGRVSLLRPGEALPSLRELMEFSGLGRAMLEKALRRSLESGLLRAEPRRGYFRTENENFDATRPIVDIIACYEMSYLNTPENFHAELAHHLFEMGTEGGYCMRLHRMKSRAAFTEYTALVRDKSILACFLMAPENAEIAQTVADAGARVVVLGPRYIPDTGPAVPDPLNMVDLQMEHLFEYGHRDIAFMHEVALQPLLLTQLLRRERYYQLMAEHGLRVYPEWVIRGWPEDELDQHLSCMFDSDHAPTALISDNAHLAQVYGFFQRRGLEIGKDISVISEGIEFSLRPRPTAVLNSRRTVAEAGWELMNNLLAGREERRQLTPTLSLMPGDSVARLNRITQQNGSQDRQRNT